MNNGLPKSQLKIPGTSYIYLPAYDGGVILCWNKQSPPRNMVNIRSVHITLVKLDINFTHDPCKLQENLQSYSQFVHHPGFIVSCAYTNSILCLKELYIMTHLARRHVTSLPQANGDVL